MINNRGFREFVVPLSNKFVLEVTCSFPKYTINTFLYSNRIIVILGRFGEQRVFSSPVVHLQRRAIVRQKVGFLYFLLFQSKNYKYETTSRVSKQAMSSLWTIL